MNFIITLLLLIVILGIIISVHEFGHFIAAKKSGVHVDEFSLGMGPLLYEFKPKKSETTYSLRLLPIGGYVAMAEKYDKESKIKKDRVLENKGFLKYPYLFPNLSLLAANIEVISPSLKASLFTLPIEFFCSLVPIPRTLRYSKFSLTV